MTGIKMLHFLGKLLNSMPAKIQHAKERNGRARNYYRDRAAWAHGKAEERDSADFFST